jgi:hypothetical protein
MLTIPQLAQIKGRDPYLYESLKQVVGAVNAAGPAPQASSGSGTATAQQGGSGFGVDQTLSLNDTLS